MAGPDHVCGIATLDSVRTENRERICHLSVGMTKEEALDVMGRKTINTYTNSGWSFFIFFPPLPDEKINNPYRTEIVPSDSGFLEVLLYYTDRKAADHAITDDELTPILLRNQKLSVGDGVMRKL